VEKNRKARVSKEHGEVGEILWVDHRRSKFRGFKMTFLWFLSEIFLRIYPEFMKFYE
jgi:hypothetical protein